MTDASEYTTHTPGPWSTKETDINAVAILADSQTIAEAFSLENDSLLRGEIRANGRLMAASPELLECAELQEAAEDAHANCEECEGEGVPELCEKCFPLFDDARVKRRLAIEKARHISFTKG